MGLALYRPSSQWRLVDQVWNLVEPPPMIWGPLCAWLCASQCCDGRTGEGAWRHWPGKRGHGQLEPGRMDLKEDSGKRQCPSPKSAVQPPKHTAHSSCYLPSSHRTLPLPGLPSAGNDLQLLPLLILQCSGRGPQPEEPSRPPSASVFIVGVIWLLSGSLQIAGFLGVGRTQACLVSLFLPHRPSLLWPPAVDMALGASRRPHRQVAMPLCREPGISATVPKALLGAAPRWGGCLLAQGQGL